MNWLTLAVTFELSSQTFDILPFFIEAQNISRLDWLNVQISFHWELLWEEIAIHQVRGWRQIFNLSFSTNSRKIHFMFHRIFKFAQFYLHLFRWAFVIR